MWYVGEALALITVNDEVFRIRPDCWPVVAYTDYFVGEASWSGMVSALTFVELG